MIYINVLVLLIVIWALRLVDEKKNTQIPLSAPRHNLRINRK